MQSEGTLSVDALLLSLPTEVAQERARAFTDKRHIFNEGPMVVARRWAKFPVGSNEVVSLEDSLRGGLCELLRGLSAENAAAMFLGLSRLLSTGTAVAVAIPHEVWCTALRETALRTASHTETLLDEIYEAEGDYQGRHHAIHTACQGLLRLTMGAGVLIDPRASLQHFTVGSSEVDAFRASIRAEAAVALKSLEAVVFHQKSTTVNERTDEWGVQSSPLSIDEWVALTTGCARARLASTGLFDEASRIAKTLIQRQRSDTTFHASGAAYALVLTPQNAAELLWSMATTSYVDTQLTLQKQDEENTLANGHRHFAQNLYQDVGDYLTEYIMDKRESSYKHAKKSTGIDRKDIRYESVRYNSSITKMDPSFITKVIWAYASIGYKHNLVVKAITEETMHRLASFSATEMVGTLWGFARLRAFSPEYVQVHIEVSQAKMAKYAASGLRFYEKHELVALLQCYATLSQEFPMCFDATPLFQRAASLLSTPLYPALTPSERMTLDSSFSKIGLSIAPALGDGGESSGLVVTASVGSSELASATLSKRQAKKLTKQLKKTKQRASATALQQVASEDAAGSLSEYLEAKRDTGLLLADADCDPSSTLTLQVEDTMQDPPIHWEEKPDNKRPERRIMESKWRSLESLHPEGDPYRQKMRAGRAVLPVGGLGYGTVQLL